MIYQSSKDYVTGVITMHFDEDTPSQYEIDEYLLENYGIGIGGVVEVEPPSAFLGFQNPGVITVFFKSL